MKIIIKNMVCPCCEIQVRRVLDEQGLKFSSIKGAELTFSEHVSPVQLAVLDKTLRVSGLQLLKNSENAIVEKVKVLLHGLVHTDHSPLKTTVSDYLCKQLSYNYSYLSNLFSEIEGKTIRDYGICLRIERAKRMLGTEKMELSDVAVKLFYSSVAHLATQFKKITGMTTSEYKRSIERTHDLIDDLQQLPPNAASAIQIGISTIPAIVPPNVGIAPIRIITLEFPEEFASKLKDNPAVLSFFETLAPPLRKKIMLLIESAKTEVNCNKHFAERIAN